MSIRQEKAIKELVEKGGSVGGAMLKAGYSPKTAKTPKKLTETKIFKEKTKPLAEGLDKEIVRIKKELATRDLSEEKYNELARSLDILIKNHQLLTGGATEKIIVSEELSDKANQAINDYFGNSKE